ncbi:SH3 domain-containing protein [Lutibaculum baratangense]|uniref:SH3b domain-containing protein n=1 Tax=Lutibaculum baratangense AMV1 TaxID=631454 RepID=V4RNS6_9HYPH|nr:SH3 domain-containing protein [Lutibaculum baratangense]ESR26889.1 hypothetical protein N177_0673 [Lutibaculum baratangense AMV1]
MLKWIPVAAIALAAFLGAPSPASAASGYATGDVNMRTGPSTRYHRILTIPRGAPVEIYGCSGSWCDTAYAGRRGWVSGRYLSTSGYRASSRGGISPGAAAAGIIGLGVAGAIISNDRRYYRHRHYRPRHYHHREWRHRPPRHHWRRGYEHRRISPMDRHRWERQRYGN